MSKLPIKLAVELLNKSIEGFEIGLAILESEHSKTHDQSFKVMCADRIEYTRLLIGAITRVSEYVEDNESIKSVIKEG